ncbi:hypothetical protein V6N13_121638 [Hibiscus sabdariffa]|uniref:RNase H type-1 domain-containing protein n=2 Tax=Hibiscus sabdariffa TaxID=183260 RepID=A0ABR2PD31_9ROSI
MKDCDFLILINTLASPRFWKSSFGESLRVCVSSDFMDLKEFSVRPTALWLMSRDASSSSISLVRVIVDYTSKSWMFDYILIKHEANFAADFLTKFHPF